MHYKQMMETRAGLIAEARAVTKRAADEKRDLTAEDEERFDRLMKEASDLRAKADRLKALEDAEAELQQSEGRQVPAEQPEDRSDPPGEREQPETFDIGPNAFGESRQVILRPERATPAYQMAFRNYLAGRGDHRALQADDDAKGGFLTTDRFQAELIQGLDNEVFMRQICRVLPPLTKAESLGAPSLDADPADPIWTSELGSGDEDSTMAVGKRALHPHPLAKRLKVSDTLIRQSLINVDGLVRERLQYKFGTTQENAFLNGTGDQQPLGIFTASDNGISTSRDVSTGNTTKVTFDGLKTAKYTLPRQYRRGSVAWIFHRDVFAQIAKEKDGISQYYWQPSVIAGEPDRLLGYPVYESEYAPNTLTADLAVGMLGNFYYYWIVDALTLSIRVVTELYIETNQIGYFGRLETDGMPVLEAAFVRIKTAAA